MVNDDEYRKVRCLGGVIASDLMRFNCIGIYLETVLKYFKKINYKCINLSYIF